MGGDRNANNLVIFFNDVICKLGVQCRIVFDLVQSTEVEDDVEHAEATSWKIWCKARMHDIHRVSCGRRIDKLKVDDKHGRSRYFGAFREL